MAKPRRLTDEQRALAEANVDLARMVGAQLSRRYDLPQIDFVAVAMHALCIAAADYPPGSPMPFSGYASTAMRRTVTRAARQEAYIDYQSDHAQPRTLLMGLDSRGTIGQSMEPIDEAIFNEGLETAEAQAEIAAPDKRPPKPCGPGPKCVRCGTTGGWRPKDRARPTRARGMCVACYRSTRTAEARSTAHQRPPR